MSLGRISKNKDYSQYVKKLLKEGWSVHPGKKHAKILTPSGRIAAFLSGSPSDGRRGIKNLKAEIKRRVGDEYNECQMS